MTDKAIDKEALVERLRQRSNWWLRGLKKTYEKADHEFDLDVADALSRMTDSKDARIAELTAELVEKERKRSNAIGQIAELLCERDTLQSQLSAVEAELVEAKARARASSSCPICGHDQPHGHDDRDIANWLSDQASRFGLRCIGFRPVSQRDAYDELAFTYFSLIHLGREGCRSWDKDDEAKIADLATAFRAQTQLEIVALQAALTSTRNARDRAREALRWYEQQVAGCRKLGSIGDPFRQALDHDGGNRARAILAEQGGE